ncbi:bacillithiol system redox-active protein YtxJ [Paenisporosarcina sp. TG20]|uniref:bacillithiol system redox-active protein YtxJ n=1 Tax=Paenisporosarcina sp. TG20 TaxID=1211706 RepID=UPI00031B874C|nr:bacillithiol system redox-active protein YtxJ [Paenisporosarcina sp. TG20]
MAIYTEITTIPEWENVLLKSQEKPVLIFKHSTTCPISAAAYKEFTSFKTDIDAYLVKVIESRPVSNEIASGLNVKHQSPQALVLLQAKPVWHTSHSSITEKNLAKAMETVL